MFAFDGEGGFTPGGAQETLNSAYGLELDNLYFVLDWNDFGIDSHPISSVVYGNPQIWFESHGWRVFGSDEGSAWESVTSTLLNAARAENSDHRPTGLWFKTRKGRGYLKYDYASHGAPHATNSDLFWETKQVFADKYGAKFINVNGKAPATQTELNSEFFENLKAVIDVLHQDQALLDYLANTLVKIGDTVGMTVSAIRWAVVDTLHSVTGLPLCHLLRVLRELGFDPPTDVPRACQQFYAYACPISAAVLRGEAVG